MISPQGPIAIARYPSTWAGFLVFAKSIGGKLKGNAALPNPPVSPAVYDADLQAFEDALTTAKTPEARADRNAKALKVRHNIDAIVGYTQSQANTQATVEDAIALILGAGLFVRKRGGYKKPELAAKYTGISGQVLMVARAIAGAGAYFWELSLNQEQWTSWPETKRGKTLITGLTPGQVYYFRFRALTDKGRNDYSQIVSIMAH